MAVELPQLLVADAPAWAQWLSEHGDRHGGVWLVLARKGTRRPTSLRYDDALEEALCHGWIDGQVARRDESTFRQRFTPRKPRSGWSQRNVAIVQRLLAEGRMRPAGLDAVARAQADGRWQAAYAGPATITVPADLERALAEEPAALAAFEALSAHNRYAILYRLHNARRADTRERRIEGFVAMLARGETPHPQGRASGDA